MFRTSITVATPAGTRTNKEVPSSSRNRNTTVCEKARHKTALVDSPAIEVCDLQKLTSFLNDRKSNSNYSTSPRTNSILSLFRITYVDAPYSHGGAQKVQISVPKDALNFVQVFIGETQMDKLSNSLLHLDAESVLTERNWGVNKGKVHGIGSGDNFHEVLEPHIEEIFVCDG